MLGGGRADALAVTTLSVGWGGRVVPGGGGLKVGPHKVVGHSSPLAGEWQLAGPASPDNLELLICVGMGIPYMTDKGGVQVVPESTVLAPLCLFSGIVDSPPQGHRCLSHV